MERALQTAHESTTSSPLSQHRKLLPPLLPAPPSPSPSTSPPQHTSTLHSDQAASSSHGRTRSLCEIYEATSFSLVLTNETILEHPQEPLEDTLPLSVHDALASSESKEWHAAILDELQALEAANTWELVPPPEHHNIVSCKWLLKKKYHPNGSVDRYKARLVARGFTQQEGVDYFDTYSPVLGMTAFWVLIILAAKFNLLLHHLDIKTAFLHGFLQELIYMLQPPHFEDLTTLIIMPRQKTTRQWDKDPYEVDDLSTNKKSHITEEVLAQIPTHIFIAKFRDAKGNNIKTTIMPREIWTLDRRPKVASAIRAVHLEQFFRLPPWGMHYMRAHEFMSSIQYDGKAMLTDGDGSKVEVYITKDIVNEALQFQRGTYDLIPKIKAIDNEKSFLKVKGNKFKYSDLIYSELELPLRLI
ncbi:hypothetical protein L7F22_046627 [Adiantum nelumboides]|nr:hypothetical protein [Adiantum nelumboides]